MTLITNFLIILLCSINKVFASTPGISQQHCFPMSEPGVLQLRTDYNTTFMLYRAVDAIGSSIVPELKGYDFESRKGPANPVKVCNETLVDGGECQREQIGSFILDGDFTIMNQMLNVSSEFTNIKIDTVGVYCLYGSSVEAPFSLYNFPEYYSTWYDFGRVAVENSIDQFNLERLFIWKCRVVLTCVSFCLCKKFGWMPPISIDHYPLFLFLWIFLVVEIALTGLTYNVAAYKLYRGVAGYSEVVLFDWVISVNMMFNSVFLWGHFILLVGLIPDYLNGIGGTDEEIHEGGGPNDDTGPEPGAWAVALIMLVCEVYLIGGVFLIHFELESQLFSDSSSSQPLGKVLIAIINAMWGASYLSVLWGSERVAQSLNCAKVTQKAMLSVYVSLSIYIGLHILSSGVLSYDSVLC